MKEQLEQRLKELKAEFEGGQQKLAKLEAQANTVRNTLLRISGAIQVLEEELDKANGANGTDPQPGPMELASNAEPEAAPNGA